MTRIPCSSAISHIVAKLFSIASRVVGPVFPAMSLVPACITTTVVVVPVSPECVYSGSVSLAPDVSFAILTTLRPVLGLVAFPTPTTRSVVALPARLTG